MDTSETYRKMCDCPEIQGQWQREDGDLYWQQRYQDNVAIWCSRCDAEFGPIDTQDAIWLPTQDRLQGMRIAHRYRDEDQIPINAVVADLDFFQDWILNDCTGLDWSYRGEVTREQLEIAFYTKEVHGKTWTGDSWKGVDNGREENKEAAHVEAQGRDSGRGWGSTGSGA